MLKTTISREQLTDLTELLEDSLEYFCDQETISGECAWTIVECLATAKLAQLRGKID